MFFIKDKELPLWDLNPLFWPFMIRNDEFMWPHFTGTIFWEWTLKIPEDEGTVAVETVREGHSDCIDWSTHCGQRKKVRYTVGQFQMEGFRVESSRTFGQEFVLLPKRGESINVQRVRVKDEQVGWWVVGYNSMTNSGYLYGQKG